MAGFYPFGLFQTLTFSLPIRRRLTKCLPPGLVALYLCDEGAGTTLTDRSGNGNDAAFGADAAAPTWTTEGIALDGVAQYAKAGPLLVGGVQQTAYAATVVLYTAAPITTASASASPLGFVDSTASTTYGRLAIGGTPFGYIANGIIGPVQRPPTGGMTAWADAAGSIAPGWHIVTINWNGSSYDIWVDSEKKPATHGTTPCALMVASEFMIGAMEMSNAPVTFFPGSAAAVAVWGAPLADAQVIQAHTAFRAIAAPRGIDINL